MYKTFLKGERGYAGLFNCNTILCILDHIHITAGADPEIEEGGSGARRTQLAVRALASFPGLRVFVARSTSLKSLRTRLRI